MFTPVLIAAVFIYFSGKFTLYYRFLCPHENVLDDTYVSGMASADCMDDKSQEFCAVLCNRMW